MASDGLSVIFHSDAMLGALRAKVVLMDERTRQATADAAHDIEREIKLQLGTHGRHAAGTPTPSPPGTPPAQVSDTLRGSIRVTGPRRIGFGIFDAEIGPTTVYGRVQELGGGRSNLPARPYVSPAILAAQPTVERIFIEAFRSAW
jgi:hypothetical protein